MTTLERYRNWLMRRRLRAASRKLQAAMNVLYRMDDPRLNHFMVEANLQTRACIGYLHGLTTLAQCGSLGWLPPRERREVYEANQPPRPFVQKFCNVGGCFGKQHSIIRAPGGRRFCSVCGQGYNL